MTQVAVTFDESALRQDIGRIGFFAALVAIFIVGGVHNHAAGWLNPDTSWLILVASQMLDGEALYQDIWETNPPFSVFLYMPMAAMERLTGVRAEFWTSAALFALIGICLGLIEHLLRHAGIWTKAQRRVFLLGLAVVFLLMQPAQFAQREHFGAIAALPLLILYALRAQGEAGFKPATAVSVAAGVIGAILIMVKPHYGLAFALPVLAIALLRRDWKALFFPESFAAVGVFAFYAVMALALYPEYFSTVAPVIAEVYFRTRLPLDALGLKAIIVMGPGLLLTGYLTTLFGTRRRPALILSLAALGAAVGMFLSGKGWLYHYYPALCAMFAGLLFVAVDALTRSDHVLRRTAPVLVAGVAFIHVAGLALFEWGGPAKDAPAELATLGDAPTMVVFSQFISTGNPLARQLGADWVGRDCADFIAFQALQLSKVAAGARKARLEAIVEDAIDRKVETLSARPVDLIVIDARGSSWTDRALTDPRLAQIMATYRRVGERGSETYFIRDFETDSMPGAPSSSIPLR